MSPIKWSILDSLEKEEPILADIEIYVMLGFISDVCPEVPANKTMPVAIIFTIELIFEVRRNLLNSVHFLKSVFGYRQYFSLHFRGYIFVFYHRLQIFPLPHYFFQIIMKFQFSC